MLLALVAVAAGVYFGFFATRGFESTTGTIVRIEEDEGGILTKVPFPGFFRIWTREERLDAIFMTVFAIGRTDMMLYN